MYVKLGQPYLIRYVLILLVSWVIMKYFYLCDLFKHNIGSIINITVKLGQSDLLDLISKN